MGLEAEELEENWLSGVLSGNKTKLCDEKEFVEFSVCRKDWGMLQLSHSKLPPPLRKGFQPAAWLHLLNWDLVDNLPVEQIKKEVKERKLHVEL